MGKMTLKYSYVYCLIKIGKNNPPYEAKNNEVKLNGYLAHVHFHYFLSGRPTFTVILQELTGVVRYDTRAN